jgi:hypothetical protein
MIIQIDDKLRIVGDERQWKCQRFFELKKPNKRGETSVWRSFSYHTNLSAAVSELARRDIRTDPATTIAEAEKAVAAIIQRYTRIFDPIATVEWKDFDTRDY